MMCLFFKIGLYVGFLFDKCCQVRLLLLALHVLVHHDSARVA